MESIHLDLTHPGWVDSCGEKGEKLSLRFRGYVSLGGGGMSGFGGRERYQDASVGVGSIVRWGHATPESKDGVSERKLAEVLALT